MTGALHRRGRRAGAMLCLAALLHALLVAPAMHAAVHAAERDGAEESDSRVRLRPSAKRAARLARQIQSRAPAQRDHGHDHTPRQHHHPGDGPGPLDHGAAAIEHGALAIIDPPPPALAAAPTVVPAPLAASAPEGSYRPAASRTHAARGPPPFAIV